MAVKLHFKILFASLCLLHLGSKQDVLRQCPELQLESGVFEMCSKRWPGLTALHSYHIIIVEVREAAA